MEFGEMKHVELEQFWHAFTSRGFDSVSWAFLLPYGSPITLVFASNFGAAETALHIQDGPKK